MCGEALADAWEILASSPVDFNQPIDIEVSAMYCDTFRRLLVLLDMMQMRINSILLPPRQNP